ncbi:hypothetical protein A3E96_00775 [Candidatus Uhrbacteria bacterium RIFCSPHIGHO2_12_FULL_46_13]|uniref:MBL fold metallo-hydrolase n=1 Tax=Candidatus Uhrbacteria bacterium RIFCSPLOWO2_01_FULL_47_25 TaxID=1802402 RepID=A0A1F7UW50_9BACT|nr:MAG: hypothetical protein UX68_C0006G0002 [Parcubacteria group bacterium GW2011_GWA2_46_9]OGL59355.1 MAG: hypothetical protein A2752_05350 [Candidatus Uhrbacteria bacterium RIFCSPHIGHO2_01_FULL_46_23]OGL68990.1 MAG: hypothetical protein A3D60_04405 [Candidatus Uhrbacteria bacterium RIFCSPHIGHO2_02_FULL_47_29]OGL76695.1 MAG: hypothetical protein A3E96_00775 [Candidatus Uhrbacteria bacterium RIFCSPHIGHO2_12_FULL_46_13]OGL82499.1 MAG: hypothetical protein A2936_02475 [Candidatus Uhrbacteria bac
MHLTSYGAAGEVTGAKHLVEAAGRRILLDCGMFQGLHEALHHHNAVLPFEASTIDVIILSHGHLDHCGSLPLLVKHGFRGKIYATSATRDVAELILRDSAHIQAQDAEYINRHLKQNQRPALPIYTSDDVEQVLPLFEDVSYRQCREIFAGIEICFYNAGHILGSSLIHLTIKEGPRIIRLAYTGDLGQRNMPILRDPDRLPDTDILIAESTYGNRVHEGAPVSAEKLINIVREAIAKKGKIFVPAFALGRMQTLVYSLHKLTDEGHLPRIPIYVDSPLAVNLTDVFSRHPECYDAETIELFTRHNEDPFGFRNLHYVHSVEESKRLNDMPGPMVILATSGMVEAGRILHHLMNGIGNPNNTVLIVGYMAEGTLGRAILEGAKRIRLYHKLLPVRAHVEKINAFSAHADQTELLNFILAISELKKVILVHGENIARQALANELLKKRPDLRLLIPNKGEEMEL